MTVRRYHLQANTVIRAGAGTGKTYALVETVTHLLAGLTHHRAPLRPAEVVCITFTEKAAGEMLERIRARVGRLADGPPSPDDPLRQSAAILEAPLPTLEAWRRARREIDQLRVSTFHGFCLALLQRYPLEAGLDPSFGVYDEAGLGRRLEQIAELEVLAALDDPDLAPAVEALLGRVRLRGLGDFGNGLAELLPRLLSSVHEAGLELSDVAELQRRSAAGRRGEDEEASLARAALTLLSRIDDRFTREKRRLAQVDFGDMQRLARNLLRDHPEIRAAVKERLRTLLVDEFQDTNPIQRDLVLLLGEPPDVAVDWRCRPAPGALPDGYELGPRRLFVVGDAKQSIYDFRGADVTSFRTVEELVAAQGGVVDSLRTSYRSRPALVAAQNALFERALAGHDDETAPWFVHWRDDAALSPHRPPTGSGPALHLLDSESLCRARARDNGRPLKLDASAELAAVAELIADIVEGPRPWRVQCERGVTAGDPAATRAARWGDVSVLLRRFVRILPLLTEQLDRRGIPYFVVKGTGFFAAREVADLSVALRALCASADAPALVAWMRGPMIGVSDEALARLAMRHGRVDRRALGRIARGLEPLALFGDRDRRALRLAADLLDRLGRRGETIGPARVIDELLAATDWAGVLAAEPQGEQALANVERVRLLASDDARRTGGSLAGFSRHLAELVEREPPAEAAQVVEAGDDVVRIMTIHQAKGLECPIAIVPDGDPGRPPYPQKLLFSPRHGLGIGRPRAALGGKRGEDPPVWSACCDEELSRRLAELRRLMYVAVTRGRDHVVLSGSAPLRKVRSKGARGSESGGGELLALARPRSGAADWMHHVYALKHEAPDWLDVISASELLERPVVERHRPAPPPPDDWVGRLARRPLGRRGTDAPPPLLGELIGAVTQVSDYAICPRRYWLQWEQGLTASPTGPQLAFEPGRGGAETLPASERAGGEVTWPADPMDRGTLAHALLERIDARAYRRLAPAERRDALDQLADRVGARLDHVTRDEVLTRVDAAMSGSVGELLARPDGERETPFVLYVPIEAREPSALVLRGQIDLVVPGDLVSPDQSDVIIDYKYSLPRAELGAYRFQLSCYALAHHRRRGSPADATYRAGIVFLREDVPRLHELGETLTADALERLGHDLGELGARLLRSRHTGVWPYLGPAEQYGRCLETHCPFRGVCFPPDRRAVASV